MKAVVAWRGGTLDTAHIRVILYAKPLRFVKAPIW
jgi:hypothetical protein